MFDVFILIKGIILTDVLARALKEWGIFDGPRNWVKAKSSFARKLLSCYECVSVWSSIFVILYLLYFEVPPITYALCFHRLACFLHVGWEISDAIRAKKEGEI